VNVLGFWNTSLADFDTTPLIAAAILATSNRYSPLPEDDTLTGMLVRNGDPSGLKYRVSALQLAVRYRNAAFVRHLLHARANPNYASNRDGIPWKDDSRLVNLNHICGTSPLAIFRSTPCVELPSLPSTSSSPPCPIGFAAMNFGGPDRKTGEKATSDRIEKLLRQNGAL
jgi:hypothetical protein